MKIFNSNKYFFLCPVLFAAAWKAYLLFQGVFSFNADEAVVALMARHIINGSRPIFFYGQAYMGSLDSFLVAIGFYFFGEHVWVIRLIQTILYLGTIITTVYIGKSIFRSHQIGFFAAMFLSIPSVNVTLYTTISLGGYGEALFIGNLIILIGNKLMEQVNQKYFDIHLLPQESFFQFLFGALVGCGFWANGMTLVYSIPVIFILATYLILPPRPKSLKWIILFVFFTLLGFVLGSFPWWLYALNNGWQQLISELLGSAVSLESGLIFTRVTNHLINFLFLGLPVIFGIRPPWEIRFLFWPLIPFIMMFWIWVLSVFISLLWKIRRIARKYWIMIGIIGTLLGGFMLTSFGIDPTGRYFIPLSIPLSLLAADAIMRSIKSFRWQIAVVALVLVYQAAGTIQCANRNPPGLTTQFYPPSIIDHGYDHELIDFLQENNESLGYTSYWIAYPLAFLSKETLIFVPKLPYHLDFKYTNRYNRYSPYNQLVERSQHPAYITANHPDLDLVLTDYFRNHGVIWKEKIIGDYHIYYHLSHPIRPAEMGLGIDSPGK